MILLHDHILPRLVNVAFEDRCLKCCKFFSRNRSAFEQRLQTLQRIHGLSIRMVLRWIWVACRANRQSDLLILVHTGIDANINRVIDEEIDAAFSAIAAVFANVHIMQCPNQRGYPTDNRAAEGKIDDEYEPPVRMLSTKRNDGWDEYYSHDNDDGSNECKRQKR